MWTGDSNERILISSTRGNASPLVRCVCTFIDIKALSITLTLTSLPPNLAVQTKEKAGVVMGGKRRMNFLPTLLNWWFPCPLISRSQCIKLLSLSAPSLSPLFPYFQSLDYSPLTRFSLSTGIDGSLFARPLLTSLSPSNFALYPAILMDAIRYLPASTSPSSTSNLASIPRPNSSGNGGGDAFNRLAGSADSVTSGGLFNSRPASFSSSSSASTSIPLPRRHQNLPSQFSQPSLSTSGSPAHSQSGGFGGGVFVFRNSPLRFLTISAEKASDIAATRLNNRRLFYEERMRQLEARRKLQASQLLMADVKTEKADDNGPAPSSKLEERAAPSSRPPSSSLSMLADSVGGSGSFGERTAGADRARARLKINGGRIAASPSLSSSFSNPSAPTSSVATDSSGSAPASSSSVGSSRSTPSASQLAHKPTLPSHTCCAWNSNCASHTWYASGSSIGIGTSLLFPSHHRLFPLSLKVRLQVIRWLVDDSSLELSTSSAIYKEGATSGKAGIGVSNGSIGSPLAGTSGLGSGAGGREEMELSDDDAFFINPHWITVLPLLPLPLLPIFTCLFFLLPIFPFLSPSFFYHLYTDS